MRALTLASLVAVLALTGWGCGGTDPHDAAVCYAQLRDSGYQPNDPIYRDAFHACLEQQPFLPDRKS